MINITTTTYTTRGKDHLQLDIYDDDRYANAERRGVVISVHNGNFLGGNRDEEVYKLSCRYFAEKGFVCVSIDYRQGLKRVAFQPSTILRAIQMGVEDLFDATVYLLQHADELNIDPQKIILMGDGAGACIALTAEYELCRTPYQDDPQRKKGRRNHLPADFNYACIASNSGAMATGERAFSWKQPPCPALLIQGEGLGDIPAGNFFVPGLLWVGGRHLHEEFSRAGARNIFIDITGLEHNSHKEGRPDRQGITHYLDSVIFRNIEILTK